MCKKRVYDWINHCIACSLSFLHLFGRVSGRGGGFFDFLPLDIVRPGCLLRNFCWARLQKLLFGYPTTSITGVWSNQDFHESIGCWRVKPPSIEAWCYILYLCREAGIQLWCTQKRQQPRRRLDPAEQLQAAVHNLQIGRGLVWPAAR